MKPQTRIHSYPSHAGAVVSVREAKAQLSALIARAAEGEEITIAWHGRPRARLSPIRTEAKLQVDREWLQHTKLVHRSQKAEVLIRADRNARG